MVQVELLQPAMSARRLIPRRRAASFLLPRVSSSARSISSRSISAMGRTAATSGADAATTLAIRVPSRRSRGVMTAPCASMHARSSVFLSSRTLPGHDHASSCQAAQEHERPRWQAAGRPHVYRLGILTMLYVATIGTLFVVWFVLVLLFTPALNYRVRDRIPVDSKAFLHLLQSTCQASLHDGNRVDVFTNGARFYPAMVAAIREARASVNLECYIFQPGKVADTFIEALTERARAGVVVTLVVDAIGSSGLSGEPLRRLAEAGCRVESYQPIRWYRLARLNNRTHRELLVVDGRVAFVGGAGVADWWQFPERRHGEAWRDTMARIEGPIVAALQGVFVENWLECCGEILTGPAFFPHLDAVGTTTAFVVKSSPSDRATVSRVAFQLLIEGATREVRISTPYFLPDRTLRQALVTTAQRGVEVRVIVPGPATDQRWVRLASRRLYGELLAGGVRIFEYEPSMTHVKALLVDDDWAVIGTTNVDNRSFEHNDEINLALLDRSSNRRLLEDFEQDLVNSREITLPAWRRRSVLERLAGPGAWILERQQ